MPQRTLPAADPRGSRWRCCNTCHVGVGPFRVSLRFFCHSSSQLAGTSGGGSHRQTRPVYPFRLRRSRPLPQIASNCVEVRVGAPSSRARGRVSINPTLAMESPSRAPFGAVGGVCRARVRAGRRRHCHHPRPVRYPRRGRASFRSSSRASASGSRHLRTHRRRTSAHRRRTSAQPFRDLLCCVGDLEPVGQLVTWL